ncbi:MAG: VanZ family protein [Phycisphaerae bacterium]
MVSKASTPKSGGTYLIAFLAYLAFVIYGSLVPLKFRYVPLEQAWEKFRHIRLLSLGIEHRSDLVANLLLFIPLTFLAMGVMTYGKARWRRTVCAPLLLMLAGMLSAGIEFVQIYFPARTVSLNDIFAEWTGGLIGIIVWFFIGDSVTVWAESLWEKHGQGDLAVKILAGYVVVFALYQLLPFDLTISPVEVYHKFKEGKITLIPFGDFAGLSAYTLLVKTAVMIPVGFLLLILSRRNKFSFAFVAILGFMFAAGIEFLQLFVYSRYSSVTDILLGMAGICAGGLLGRVYGPVASKPLVHGRFWRYTGGPIKFTAAVAWIWLLAWSRWYPFNFQWPEETFAENLQEHIHIPFLYQYLTSEFLAATQVVREFIIFFILGLMVKSLLGNRRGWAILILAVLAIILEGGQLFVPSRFFDLTTIGINIIGGSVGVWFYPSFIRNFVLPSDNLGSTD